MKKFLSDQQQQLVVAFIANLVALLHEDGHSRECVQDSAKAGVACLFEVWDIDPDSYDADKISDFVGGVIVAVLTKFYGAATVGLQA